MIYFFKKHIKTRKFHESADSYKKCSHSTFCRGYVWGFCCRRRRLHLADIFFEAELELQGCRPFLRQADEGCGRHLHQCSEKRKWRLSRTILGFLSWS